MATAKRLPSGRWRIRVYLGKDPSGKDVYKSFTGPTKRDVERTATTYVAENRFVTSVYDMTVKAALERYIKAKTPVLSPSTIRGYRVYQRSYYDSINDKKICQLVSEDMQMFISSLVGTVSAKSVSNIYSLLLSSVTMFRPDAVFRVTLPSKKKVRKSSPSDADVKTLFLQARPELQLCIALAAFGSLRRGEICALKHCDVTGQSVYVHADMVVDENNEYHYKEIPKTSDSIRTVLLPQEVIDLIPDGVDDEFIVSVNPDALTSRFRRLRDRLGINVCFHDLRHYFASIGVVLGIPDRYLSEFGGWRNESSVMKQVYQNRIDEAAKEYANTLVSHFSSVIASETA